MREREGERKKGFFSLSFSCVYCTRGGNGRDIQRREHQPPLVPYTINNTAAGRSLVGGGDADAFDDSFVAAADV